MPYGYDERGDLYRRSTQLGSGLPLRYTYDDEDRITSWTDRNSAGTATSYDAAGRCPARRHRRHLEPTPRATDPERADLTRTNTATTPTAA